MTYSFDSHSQKLKHLLYKNLVENSKFSSSQFQNARKSTTPEKVIDSLNRIGTCLNGLKTYDICKKDLDNVCFLICNTYKNRKNSLGVSPLNDCYLAGQINFKRGYRVYYIHDPTREEFLKYLTVFLKYTKKNLLIYYSGRCTTLYENNVCDSAMVFNEGFIKGNELNSFLSKKSNKNVKIVLFCDCFTGSSIWNLNIDGEKFPSFPDNVVSIYPVYNKDVKDLTKKAEEMHGIFTYYLSKYTSEVNDISPKYLMERMNSRFEQFDMSIMIEATKNTIKSQPIFE